MIDDEGEQIRRDAEIDARIDEDGGVIVVVEVVCGAVAAMCHCIRPVGHDGPHGCNPKVCRGQWLGDFDGDDFEIVTMASPAN